MDGVVEIISGRERRRRWSTEDKLRLVAEAYEPGAAIRAVAARHGVCESLLFTWRRQVREGMLTPPEMATFMPVQMLEAPLTAPPRSGPPAAIAAAVIGARASRSTWMMSNRRSARRIECSRVTPA
jgi:transposase